MDRCGICAGLRRTLGTPKWSRVYAQTLYRKKFNDNMNGKPIRLHIKTITTFCIVSAHLGRTGTLPLLPLRQQEPCRRKSIPAQNSGLPPMTTKSLLVYLISPAMFAATSKRADGHCTIATSATTGALPCICIYLCRDTDLSRMKNRPLTLFLSSFFLVSFFYVHFTTFPCAIYTVSKIKLNLTGCYRI